MNLLKKTYCTVIGPMQYGNGKPIRDYFKKELGDLGIIIFDHFNKPFINDEPENEELHKLLSDLMKEEKYDEIAKYRSIRTHDLSLIDRSDFIIFHFIPGVVTVGSWEEWNVAIRAKKPIFFITEGGKQLTPLWVMWAMPHKYIYDNKEQVLEEIRKIDSGEKSIDSSRWKLLKTEWR